MNTQTMVTSSFNSVDTVDMAQAVPADNFLAETSSSIRVVIPVVSSAAQVSGITRHAANLAQSLLTRSDIASITLIMADWQYKSLRSIIPTDDPRLKILSVKIGPSVLSRNLWYYLTLPSLSTELKSDIVHFAYPAPVNARAFNCRTVVTLHDFYPYDIPENFGFPKVLFNRKILHQCLQAIDAIACVSDSTLQRLDMYAPQLALQKASTIYNCVKSASSLAIKGPMPEWDGEPFLLVVAQHRRNKNILLALRVFERLLHAHAIDHTSRLLIIGLEGPETQVIADFIRIAGLARKVFLFHGVSDSELQWCYEHCELLMAPSTVEGFGLPVAEALLHGCHVVCSDIPAFRELGGEHCLYVSLALEPEDGFVRAVQATLCKPRATPVSLPQLSAPIISQKYLQLYRKLLASHTVRSGIPGSSVAATRHIGDPHEHI